MKLHNRLSLVIGLVLVVVLAGLEWFSYRQARQEAVDDLRREGEHVYNLLMATRRVYQHQFIDSGLPLTDKTVGFLPAHALGRISLDFAGRDHSGLSFNNVSDQPRNPRNRADAVEMAAIRHFRAHPEEKVRFTAFRGPGGQPYYLYARPIRVEPYCLTCHGSRGDAPPTIAQRYDGAYGYRVGDLRGIISIKLPAGHVDDKAVAFFRNALVWHGLAFLAIYLAVVLIIRRQVGVPLVQLNRAMDAVAAGDFRVPVGAMAGEFGQVACSFRHMADSLAGAQERLERSEERFRSIAGSITDAIVVADLEGRIVFWNAGAERLLGHAAADVIGQPVTCIIPEHYRADHLAAMARLAAGGESRLAGRVVEITALHRDGQEVPVEISLCHWSTREERYFAAVLRDIAARKRAEAELERHRHHLEELVDVRTTQLERAKAAAEAANRAKSVFLANMSHELRTPLNAILGFAQIMERDPGIAPEHRRELATINRSGHHLLALINDVLEISRIEAGRDSARREPFDLEDAVTVVAEMIQSRAEAKGLDFRVARQGALPRYVAGDGHRLKQVLLNLLGNAVKFTDRGGVTLEIAVAADLLTFAVADTGRGIPETERERVFQAFHQAPDGVALGEGSGLGLTISREYVRMMGGELSLDSTQGQGSRFTFALPLPACPAMPPAVAERRVAGLAPGEVPPRVLVAEDDPDSRELLLRYLADVGIHAQAAGDGRQALAMFEAWRPQLVWMDMRMPVLDGYAATRAMRALPGGEAVKIVAVTAAAFQEDRAAILAAGCDDLLSKPVEAAALYAVMATQLGLRYRYREDDPGLVDAEPGVVELGGLPADLRAALRSAAEALDMESVDEAIDRICDFDSGLAAALRTLARQYRFDLIAERCSRGASPDQSRQ